MRKKDDFVILVDKLDNACGIMEKLEAHKQGVLHRAFSVCLINHKGELLLHKRAKSKYHSGGKWTNTCCSHPRPKERTLIAANRRLKEEMGITADIEEVFSFIYRVNFDNGLIENEFDHVYVGLYDGKPTPNSDEVEEWGYFSIEYIEKSIRNYPERYTYWFRLLFPKLIKEFTSIKFLNHDSSK